MDKKDLPKMKKRDLIEIVTRGENGDKVRSCGFFLKKRNYWVLYPCETKERMETYIEIATTIMNGQPIYDDDEISIDEFHIEDINEIYVYQRK